jgi:hypothetical protein
MCLVTVDTRVTNEPNEPVNCSTAEHIGELQQQQQQQQQQL